MQRYYVVTIWSEGRPGKKWKTMEEPEVIPEGTGVFFRDMGTRLPVKVIGNVSIEEYEHGLDYPDAEEEEPGKEV